jgi:hypothetical protein
VPIIGSKTDADFAASFVKLEDLSDDERRVMVEAGRTTTVITRDRHVAVADKGLLLPKHVARQVQDQVSFHFSVANNTEMWNRLKVRPTGRAADPYQTDMRYCVYDEPFRTYLYTQAWVKRIVNEIGTVEKYRAFFGREPRMKVSRLSGRAEVGAQTTAAPLDQPA